VAADDPQQQVPPWWTDPTKNVESLVESAMRRQDDLRTQDTEDIRREMRLRAHYEALLREAESGRINAIREVDVGAVQRAAEVQATQAGALAAQVIATADAFRVSLAAALEPIQKDIRDLRDSQARGVGSKEQVVETRDVKSESRLNLSTLIAALILAVALYAALHK
jgi:hypothetical protein